MEKSSRILGGLFGVACGDALGGTLEFLTQDEGKKKHGYLKDIIGGGCWDLEPGEVTDDTMMTIAVAEGILDNPENPINYIGERFMKWYLSKPKDIGEIIEFALREYSRSKDWSKTAKFAHDYCSGMSAGNGSLMRCIPVALYYEDINKMIEVTEKQSKLTHFDDKATRACVLYNKLVNKYINGASKIPAIREVIKEFQEYKEVFNKRKEELEPSGYVVDTLICSLWCFINTVTFEDAVCEAVNLCGDADTIGAITAGLAGVYYGFFNIPERWKDKILVKDKLMEIPERLGLRNE
ncbi:ADP-ribosylglycohydrolase family protein [Clostridium saccharobutylicum]|uniref:ADP-ribosyl-[dinitrogen reductase] glycohydrolase n=1 Tax=Clostridium saccharobutylicum TaxID=169679 RepID=A0A1S8MYX5_CLOSA|nr:ADP-ribosylglycohydrolase family protein [Clostridium saccharobutylicum]OOM09426.1 ADP-ribosyl-[dinitrogen reductase] glycohydrolase [Clostridium saccharobutylicum]